MHQLTSFDTRLTVLEEALQELCRHVETENDCMMRASAEELRRLTNTKTRLGASYQQHVSQALKAGLKENLLPLIPQMRLLDTLLVRNQHLLGAITTARTQLADSIKRVIQKANAPRNETYTERGRRSRRSKRKSSTPFQVHYAL